MKQYNFKIVLILILFFYNAIVGENIFRLEVPLNDGTINGNNGKSPSEGPPFLRYEMKSYTYYFAADDGDSIYAQNPMAVENAFNTWNAVRYCLY